MKTKEMSEIYNFLFFGFWLRKREWRVGGGGGWGIYYLA